MEELKTKSPQEKETWESTKPLLGAHQVELGSHWSRTYRHDPACLPHVLSKYKFSSKIACRGGSILELNCSEGIGASILAENMDAYLGIDANAEAIAAAKKNFSSPKFQFIQDEFLKQQYTPAETLIGFDIMTQHPALHIQSYLNMVYNHLTSHGICVLGEPYTTARNYGGTLDPFPSLRQEMERYFHYVFPFSMQEEIVSAGLSLSASYILFVGFEKRSRHG